MCFLKLLLFFLSIKQKFLKNNFILKIINYFILIEKKNNMLFQVYILFIFFNFLNEN